MTNGRVVAGVVGGLGSLVLAGGVAAAVTQAHTDPMAKLPAVCRDNPGSAGGKLPGGKKLETALRQLAANPGLTKSVVADVAPALGSGSAADLVLRGQALAGSGGVADGLAAGIGVTGGGSTSSGSGVAPGSGNGGGAGGAGGLSGTDTGPAGGQGTSPIVGSGPDPEGVPQPANPKIPPPVIPPVPPKVSHSVGKAVAGVLVALLVAALLVGAYLLLRRRPAPEGRLPDGTGMQPAHADALARNALSQGDLDAALRWTFVSGLLRLDQVGVLPYDAARTTRECSRWVRSAHFPVLADGFDLVAYGGRHATMPDVIEARNGWNALLADVVRRDDAEPDRAAHGPLVRR